MPDNIITGTNATSAPMPIPTMRRQAGVPHPQPAPEINESIACSPDSEKRRLQREELLRKLPNRQPSISNHYDRFQTPLKATATATATATPDASPIREHVGDEDTFFRFSPGGDASQQPAVAAPKPGAKPSCAIRLMF